MERIRIPFGPQRASKFRSPPESWHLLIVYDALVSERVYKKRWTHEDTTSEIIAKRGTHFDPDVVDAFVAEADNFKAIAERYRD